MARLPGPPRRPGSEGEAADVPPLRESATPAASRPAVPIALAFLSGVALARALPGSSGPVLAVVAALAGLGSAAVARADRRTGLAPVLLLLAAVIALGAARRLDAEADETAGTGALDLPPSGSQAMLKA